MSARRRIPFELPVMSRLTLAWFAAFGALATIGGAFGLAALAGKNGARVSLPVDRLEIMAHAPVERRGAEERLPAPEPRAGDDAEDSLLYPEEFDLAEGADDYVEGDYAGDDIVITIPGAKRPAVAVSNASLTHPAGEAVADPDPELLRATPFGAAPRIGPDGRKAMHAYARAHDNSDTRPEIALIVGGLGLNAALTERAIDELPPDISLAFAPYAKDLAYWSAKARRAGHEVLIELPMEGYGESQDSLGPAGLLTSRSAVENRQRLEWLMTRFSGYFAATNYLGAKFSADKSSIGPVLEALRAAGVAYVDDTGAARAAAADSGALVATVNRVIPGSPEEKSRSLVRRELRALETIAKRDGAALGKSYAHAATLDEIIAWTAELNENGFAAAPASAVLPSRAATR